MSTSQLDQTGLYANKPDAKSAGKGFTYRASDTKETLVSNGTVWVSRAVPLKDDTSHKPELEVASPTAQTAKAPHVGFDPSDAMANAIQRNEVDGADLPKSKRSNKYDGPDA